LEERYSDYKDPMAEFLCMKEYLELALQNPHLRAERIEENKE
jgi:hypothetical protein